MESPDSYILSKIRWQFFGSLTFKTETCPRYRRISKFFALIRSVARDFHAYFPNLPWCLRLERGPIGLRLHNHFLLAGLPDEAISTATCFFMMKRWEIKFHGGFARIELFDPVLNGLDYIGECLAYENGSQILKAANLGDTDSELRYSNAVWNEENHFRKRIDR
jgi:hypothetical protein